MFIYIIIYRKRFCLFLSKLNTSPVSSAAERLTFNQVAEGSIPSRGIIGLLTAKNSYQFKIIKCNPLKQLWLLTPLCSSVGRALDCRGKMSQTSTGRWFESGRGDF